MRADLETLLAAAGVEERLVAPLARYGALVLETNARFNLTGAKSARELAPHLVDSLSIVPFVRDSLIDVGSGAGLPAIPVALAIGVPITLVETTGKKARFLQRMLETFELAGDVLAVRAEFAGRDERWRDRFASGSARAVATAPTVAELLLPFIKPGGVAILQRGTMDDNERAALADVALMLGAEVEEERPLDGGRRIVLVRKHTPTPLRFPRRTGVPEKRPLCT